MRLSCSSEELTRDAPFFTLVILGRRRSLYPAKRRDVFSLRGVVVRHSFDRRTPLDATQGDAMHSATDVKFKVGDKAVYPAQGVAEVIKIEEKDIAGCRQRFYVLRILDTDRKIMVPVSNASAVGLRQVISEQEIREIFDILKERTIAFDNQTWNRRYRGFIDKIKTGSIYDVAEVLRDLYRLKTDKQLSFGERRMLDEARTLIVKEIATAREQTEDEVKNEIEAIFVSN